MNIIRSNILYCVLSDSLMTQQIEITKWHEAVIMEFIDLNDFLDDFFNNIDNKSDWESLTEMDRNPPSICCFFGEKNLKCKCLRKYELWLNTVKQLACKLLNSIDAHLGAIEW